MITLNLTIEQVNTILESLGSQPYVKVVDLVQEIREQAIPQANQSESNVMDGEIIDQEDN